MTLIYKIDLDTVNMNHRAKYLGQRLFRSKLLSGHTNTHTHTHTQTTDRLLNMATKMIGNQLITMLSIKCLFLVAFSHIIRTRRMQSMHKMRACCYSGVICLSVCWSYRHCSQEALTSTTSLDRRAHYACRRRVWSRASRIAMLA